MVEKPDVQDKVHEEDKTRATDLHADVLAT